MTCPNCRREAMNTLADFCPFCGALYFVPDNSPTPHLAVAQRQRPVPLPSESPGALLTGRAAMDAAWGFLSEILAFGLLAFGIWQLVAGGEMATLLQGAGLVVTAGLILWHSAWMRRRYPAFAKGWKRGRDTWGVGAEHLITLVYGLILVTVLFPLGAFLACFGASGGIATWCVVLVIVYLLGLFVRRVRGRT